METRLKDNDAVRLLNEVRNWLISYTAPLPPAPQPLVLFMGWKSSVPYQFSARERLTPQSVGPNQ